ncbi:hypothetical protein IMSHALPRED_008076 [Imshaugia aleurites]|uniref:Uncharacterized protein n=1 Tax=Imshaugia aleurites TaxID=172621 RepID=A0A8H3FYZ9_9LECA|nr:hypothetical protein IMSHALPRED_008076 [Imshaugia aleurites]
MLYLPCLFIALILAGVVDAFAAWLPNCTTPAQHVNFVSNPQVRGTMDIIWTCFAVLSLCTWTIQHLMVPIPKARKKVSVIRKYWEKVSFNYTKLKWMGVCIGAPEFVLGKALNEYLAAHDSRRQFKKWFATNEPRRNFDSQVAYDMEEEPDGEVWTTAHGFFANMRGFVLRFDVAAVPTSLEPSKPTELGRSRQNPRLVTRDGDPPYYEQEAKKAEATELHHCREICKRPCQNRANVPGTIDYRFPAPSLSSPPYHLAEPNSDIGQQNINAEGVEQPEKSVVDAQREPESLKILVDQAPQTYPSPTEATAVTLVNSPDFTRHNIAAGLTPSTYALRPLMPSHIIAQQDPSPEYPQKIDTADEKLGPHKTWKGSWALSSIQLLYACQKGIIPGPPELSTEHLEDRSKGDIFVKGVAVLQISWLVIQIIARASEGLAISLLEITTLAFATCAIATYILLWHKPQDVMTPTYIDARNILTRDQVIGLAARSPVSTLFVHEFWLHGVAIRGMADNVFPWTRGIPIRLPWRTDTIYLNPIFIGIGFGGALFGTVHFIAWNFEFPTPVERILWRTSCCLIITIPLLGTAMYFVTIHNARRDSETDTKTNALLRPFTRMCILLYLLARLYLVVEVFRSLAYAPPSTFHEINWPSAIPHVN